MAKFIIYKRHRGTTGIISLKKNDIPLKVIEHGQRQMQKQGLPNGITWKLHEGNFVSAMVATTKI